MKSTRRYIVPRNLWRHAPPLRRLVGNRRHGIKSVHACASLDNPLNPGGGSHNDCAQALRLIGTILPLARKPSR